MIKNFIKLQKINFFKILNQIFKYLNRRTEQKLKSWAPLKPLTINNIKVKIKDRCKVFTIINRDLDSEYIALNRVFLTLMQCEEFLAFGEYKVIIVTVEIEENVYPSYHQNVLIKNAFEEYYDKVKDYIFTIYYEHYPMTTIPKYHVTTWNVDNIANKHIKITQTARSNYKTEISNKRQYSTAGHANKEKKEIPFGAITPILSTVLIDEWGVIDLETASKNDTNTQIPIAVSSNFGGIYYAETLVLDSTNIENDVHELIGKYFDWLIFHIMDNITKINNNRSSKDLRKKFNYTRSQFR